MHTPRRQALSPEHASQGSPPSMFASATTAASSRLAASAGTAASGVAGVPPQPIRRTRANRNEEPKIERIAPPLLRSPAEEDRATHPRPGWRSENGTTRPREP